MQIGIKLMLVLCFSLVQSQVTLDSLIEQKELEVGRIADAMSAAYERYLCDQITCDCSYSACVSQFDSKTCAETFGSCDGGSSTGRNLDFTNSAVRYTSTFSDSSNLLDMCWTLDGADAFLQNYGDTLEQPDKTLKWQYFGVSSGTYRIFPGVAQETCGSYDPRLRPWYSAASSGPKDVVLVLDVSGSMDSNGRLDLLKTAVDTVLTTLTLNDYVAIVTFHTTAEQLCGNNVNCGTLSQATTSVIDDLKTKVSDLTARDLTNFEAGLTRAFDILEFSTERSSNCHKAILFLTDGTSTAGASGTTLLNLISSRQSQLEASRGRKAVMFTYSLGTGAAVTVPKSLACESDGIWTAVSDGSDLRSQMGHFYDYFASLRDQSTVPTPVWVEPYEDASGAGQLTTASVAVYDTQFDPPRLVGVAGVDLLVSDIVAIESDYEQLLQYLTLRSNTCPSLTLDDCQLKELRTRTYGNFVTSADRTCPGDSSLTCSSQEAVCSNTGIAPNPTIPSTSSSYCNRDRVSFKAESCDDCSKSSSSSSTIGIGIGIAVAVLLFLIILFCCCKKKSDSSSNQPTTSYTVQEPKPAYTSTASPQQAPPPSYTSVSNGVWNPPPQGNYTPEIYPPPTASAPPPPPPPLPPGPAPPSFNPDYNPDSSHV